VQSFLQSTRPANDVLLYYPIHDRWAQRGTGTMPHFSGPQGTTAQEAGQALVDRGYTFDFISDRLLLGVQFIHGVLQTGGNPYRTIVVPETKLMPLPTLEKLVALAQAGATIIFQQGLPSDVPGFGELEARRASLQQLRDKLGGTKTDDNDAIWVEVGAGRIYLAGKMEQLLTRAGVRREALVDGGLSFERRAHDGGYVYFLLNRGTAPFAGWVPLAPDTKTAALFEPMTSQHGLAALRPKPEGGMEAYVELAPGDSTLLKTFTARTDGPAYAYWTVGETRPFSGAWSVRFTSGGPELPAAVDVTELKSWTEFGGEAVKAFSGTAAYTLTFARPAGEAAAWQLDLGRVAESARVRLNGVEVAALIKPPYRVTLPAAQLKEQNTLEVLVTNLSANRIADLDRRGVAWKRFYNTNIPARLAANRGPDGLFSAAKWPPRPSGLIGPVTLAPLASKQP
jgi:alpha-L-rhamnosidase